LEWAIELLHAKIVGSLKETETDVRKKRKQICVSACLNTVG
jgi:hypothetical protein